MSPSLPTPMPGGAMVPPDHTTPEPPEQHVTVPAPRRATGSDLCPRCGADQAVSFRLPAVLRRMRRDMAAMNAGPACVLAWLLAEGDMLPGGETVLAVVREPVAGAVQILADDGCRRQYRRNDRVMVARRAWEVPVVRVPRFVAALRPQALADQPAPAEPSGVMP